MNVTYATQSFESFFAEAGHLLQDHWREVARDQDEVPYDPDVPQYLLLDSIGALQVLVARCNGKMVGYHLSIIRPHLHYKSTLHAFTDIYYVNPEYRRGTGAGINLFLEAVRLWAKRGVRKAYTGTKIFGVSALGKSLDISLLLKRQGWQLGEHMFTLLIGDEE